MRFDTNRLLKLPPLTALMVIVNENRTTALNPNHIRVKTLTALEGTSTSVVLESYEPTDPFVKVRYSGESSFVYNRISVEQFFGTRFFVRCPLPVSTHDVLDIISEHSGIKFDERDFPLEIISSRRYFLQAKPESLRWFGGVDIEIRPTAEQIDLNDYFMIGDLSGFKSPITLSLSQAVKYRELNGFGDLPLFPGARLMEDGTLRLVEDYAIRILEGAGDYRLMEDGALRLTEQGQIRLLEPDTDYRLEENGTIRLTEDGYARLMENSQIALLVGSGQYYLDTDGSIRPVV